MKLAGLLGIAMAVVLFLGADNGSAQEKIKWRMTTGVGETSTYTVLFAKPFAELVNKLTDGQVEIEVFGAGVIAPAFQVYGAVEEGLADVAHAWPGYLVNEHPANGIFAGQVGGLGTDGHFAWLTDGGGEDIWQEFRRARNGLHTMVLGISPPDIHLHSVKPVRTVEDLQGMKIRTAGPFAEVVQKFGASSVTIPGSEVYSMLERRAVDAIEWATPSDNMKLGFHKIAKYVIMPGVHNPAVAFEFVIKPEVWEALPEDIRQKIEIAAQIVTVQGYNKWLVEDLNAMVELKKGDNEIIDVDPSYLAAMSEAGREWAYEKAEGDEMMRKVADSYYGFFDLWTANNTAVALPK